MTPTPEEIEQLRLSGETLSAIAAKAKLADELEATLEAAREDLMNVSQTAADRRALIQRLNVAVSEQANKAERFRRERDAARGATLATLPEAEVIAIQELKDDRRKLRAALDKAREGLGNTLPEWEGQSIHELTQAAGAEINRLRDEILVLQDSRGILMAEVDKLTGENKGLNDHIETQHVAWWKAIQAILPEKPMEASSSLVEDVIECIQDLRAENGRQATVIAEMRQDRDGARRGNQAYREAMDSLIVTNASRKEIIETIVRWLNEGATLTATEPGTARFTDGILGGVTIHGAKAGILYSTPTS